MHLSQQIAIYSTCLCLSRHTGQAATQCKITLGHVHTVTVLRGGIDCSVTCRFTVVKDLIWNPLKCCFIHYLSLCTLTVLHLKAVGGNWRKTFTHSKSNLDPLAMRRQCQPLSTMLDYILLQKTMPTMTNWLPIALHVIKYEIAITSSQKYKTCICIAFASGFNSIFLFHTLLNMWNTPLCSRSCSRSVVHISCALLAQEETAKHPGGPAARTDRVQDR